MTTKRKVLTAVFLVLFLFGALIALSGEIGGAFIYWFVLAVVFTGMWFLLGGGTAPRQETVRASKTRVFFITLGKTIAFILLASVVAGTVVVLLPGTDAGGAGEVIGRLLVIAIIWAFIRSFRAARRVQATPPNTALEPTATAPSVSTKS